jgi:pseudaminic acid synthase
MKTEVICEISNAHNGDFGRAIRLIDAAKKCGATMAKFQCFTPDELVELRGDGPAPEPWGSQGHTMRSLYEKAQTPHAWFRDLVLFCKNLDMPWFSSVFGLESLALLESLDCPRYKIAALDMGSGDLRDAVLATGKPAVFSVREHDEDVWWIADGNPSASFLYCPPGYPQTSIALSNCGSHHGLSYHGTDPLIPAAAVAAGAKMVEVHFMLDDEPSELESNVSLGEKAFREMVSMIQRIEAVQ